MTGPQLITQEWARLGSRERERLVPMLLASIPGWRLWASEPQGMFLYLEQIFENANVPFMKPLSEDLEAQQSGADGHA